MRFIFTVSVLLLAWAAAQAQPLQHKLNVFLVELTDKNNSTFSVFHPEEYLSARALERRARQGIDIDETDLPVNADYINQIRKLGGIIHASSKWFNSLAVYMPDTNSFKPIQQLPFVRSVRYLGKWREPKNFPVETKRTYKTTYKKTNDYHGYAEPQTKLSSVDVLHSWGYNGLGMHVAIFDGGFSNVYRSPAFDSLNVTARIVGTHDFVDHNDYVYESSTHGTNVLSCMAANLPFLVVGTAPYADYHLFKTEDVLGEFQLEEFNWLAAAERSDSVGIDVVNSSLGYTEFSDTTMSYKYKRDLNGNTALITRAADMAVSKGILIVNSAGNEGSGKWHYIGTPADGFNVISVGAVSTLGVKAGFSSWGPTADGRLKPNLVAVGDNTVVASMTDYDVTTSDGTSFSSPVLAGMLTAFWQAFPEKTNIEIKRMAEESAHQFDKPEMGLGYGIPDFYLAYIQAKPALVLIDSKGAGYSKHSLVQADLPIVIEVTKKAIINIKLYNSLQQVVYQQDSLEAESQVCNFKIPKLEEYAAGVYMLMVEVNGRKYYFEVVRSPFKNVER